MVDDIPKIKPKEEENKPQLSATARQAVAKAEAKMESAKPQSSPSDPQANPNQSTSPTLGDKEPILNNHQNTKSYDLEVKAGTKADSDAPKVKPINKNVSEPQGKQPSRPSILPPSAVKPKKKLPKWLKIIGIIFGFLIILSALIAIPAFKTVRAAKNTLTLAKETYTAGKNQNLPEFNQKLEATKSQLVQTHKIYKILSWTKFIPLARKYYQDGDHAFKAAIAAAEAAQILGDTIAPYADVLGFQGQGSFTGGTAEDRITKIVETLDKVTPEIDKISQKIKIASDELNQINAKRYPFTIKGKNLKESIISAQTLTHDILIGVTDAKPVIEMLPAALGIEEEKKYLVLFQNDAEIRPTGGFLTAYGILRIDKGKIYQEKSDDIYELDAKFRKNLEPPELIEKYLPLVYYWNLRDMNLSPDFKESMNIFYSYYKEVPGEAIVDGIIAVDTQVLNDLVSILGPIDVPGYGTFSSETDPRCNCPQVIYELEDMATRPVAYVKSDRKGFLAPMLQTLLLKAYGSPKNLWPGLFQTGLRNINEKHVLFYLLDDDQQQAVEGVNIAGRIQDYDADYFHINDINFAGAKSNLFITEEVEQAITIAEDGTITKRVTVTYKNPAPASNCNLEAGELCLNGIYRDVVRLYVPQGSQLTESLGFEEDSAETKEELGKTVFQGFFTLSPESQAKIVFEYTLPFKQEGDQYRMLIQKQPGKKKPKYTITINEAHEEEFELATDKEVEIDLR